LTRPDIPSHSQGLKHQGRERGLSVLYLGGPVRASGVAKVASLLHIHVSCNLHYFLEFTKTARVRESNSNRWHVFEPVHRYAGLVVGVVDRRIDLKGVHGDSVVVDER
jgi:hypothetical protein